jgi:RNA polymerase sigma-70 factor (ECF subfamily)
MTLDDLLDTYGPALKRVAASYAPPGPEREDLEQEIVLALHTAWPGWRGDASARTFAYRIAHNCGILLIKRRRRAPETEPLDERHAVTRRTPEDLAQERQDYERLARAVRQLPLAQRQPMALRLDGLSYAEIGEVLGLTTSNVGVRLHRATDELKRLMKGGQ